MELPIEPACQIRAALAKVVAYGFKLPRPERSRLTKDFVNLDPLCQARAMPNWRSFRVRAASQTQRSSKCRAIWPATFWGSALDLGFLVFGIQATPSPPCTFRGSALRLVWRQMPSRRLARFTHACLKRRHVAGYRHRRRAYNAVDAQPATSHSFSQPTKRFWGTQKLW